MITICDTDRETKRNRFFFLRKSTKSTTNRGQINPLCITEEFIVENQQFFQGNKQRNKIICPQIYQGSNLKIKTKW